MKCCFTGHRNVKVTDELEKRLEDEIVKLINLGVTDFYAGGAVGWDMLCEKTVLRLRDDYPVRLNNILPCKEDIFTSEWNEMQKNDLHQILSLTDNVKVLSENFTKECYKNRNRQLTENADFCICFYNEKRQRCGTAQTVRMAEKKGMTVVNLYR